MIIIGLGANLKGPFGSPQETLRACVDNFVHYGITPTQASSIWRTAPVPASDQPWYYNAVCAIETPLNPEALLAALKQMEVYFGREIGSINAPRVLDLDLLAYNDRITNTADLCLPHPRLHERAFVLRPLFEIAPDWRHPHLKIRIPDMLAAIPAEQTAAPSENERPLL